MHKDILVKDCYSMHHQYRRYKQTYNVNELKVNSLVLKRHFNFEQKSCVLPLAPVKIIQETITSVNINMCSAISMFL